MFCTKCGSQVPEGNKFCTNCGAPMGSAPAATPAPAPDVVPAPSDTNPEEAPSWQGKTQVMGGAAGDVARDAAQTRVMGFDDKEDTADRPLAGPAPYVAPYDESPYDKVPQKKAGSGLIATAVVLGILAVLAIAAVVVVFVDPFDLNLLGVDQQSVAEEPASDEADDDKVDKDDDKADKDKDDKDEADKDKADKDDKDGAGDSDDEGELEHISISERPSKSEYEVGEKLNPSGLVLTLTFENGDKDEVAYAPGNAADFSFTPETFDSAGSAVSVTVTYEGLEASFSVVVTEAESQDYILPDSATHLYTTSELEHLSDWELYIARNEIYARHGREFQTATLQDYFNGQSWYEPRYSPSDFDAQSDTLLNETERKNASTILALEQSRGSDYI